LVIPPLVEQIRYAWHRGELRAKYETSGDGLRNVSLEALTNAYQMVSDRVGASVVHIDVVKKQASNKPNDRFRPSLSSDQGSGVVVSKEGHILTNHHVIKDGDGIQVTLRDGRRVPAVLLGEDLRTDLALLKAEVTDLMPVDWGDSDGARVGTPVWAVGSPFGLESTITHGILSGIHRAAKAGNHYQDFMQSDVAVNPGNSGGPLVDSQGRMIGVNTAIVGDTFQGVSFSIPSNVARQVFERLKADGEVRRGWIGVWLSNSLGADQRPVGALVTGLAPDSPAGRAGVLVGDVIQSIGERPIQRSDELIRKIVLVPPGQQVELEVVREGEARKFSVTVGTRPLGD
jgi:serine protease Do